jgi:hypothetical protein
MEAVHPRPPAPPVDVMVIANDMTGHDIVIFVLCLLAVLGCMVVVAMIEDRFRDDGPR